MRSLNSKKLVAVLLMAALAAVLGGLVTASAHAPFLNVWTDEQQYRVGEVVTIYYYASKPCIADLTIYKNSSPMAIFNNRRISAGTYTFTGTAGYPLGQRIVDFRGQAIDHSIAGGDEASYTVVDGGGGGGNLFDSDGDCIPDFIDQCPYQSGPLPTGCPSGDESGDTCPKVPFPLPDFPWLDCGDFQSQYDGPPPPLLSPSIHFDNPGGPKTKSVPYGIWGIPIYITNIPMNQYTTILLADIILPNWGPPQVQVYNLTYLTPTSSGYVTTNAYAGTPGVEYFIAWVDANNNGVVDGPGELTIPWLTMDVHGNNSNRLPDLLPTELLRIYHPPVWPGNDYQLSYRAKNAGNGDITTYLALGCDVNIYSPGGAPKYHQNTGNGFHLKAGESKVEHASIPHDVIETGDIVEIVLDTGNRVKESNEENNRALFVVTPEIFEPYNLNPLFISVWSDKTNYADGDLVNIHYSVNQPCQGKLTVVQHGSPKVLVNGPISAGEHVFTGIAQGTGQREVIFEAWAGSQYKKVITHFNVYTPVK